MYHNTPFDLTGKKALVTGGSRGLGKEMARIFAQAGAEVMICSRTEGPLRETAQTLSAETGARIEWTAADMAVRAESDRLAARATERLGRVDILVVNAGHNIPQTIDRVRDEDWDQLFELNTHSAMALTRALVPGMMERRWGRVIYISSIMAFASTRERAAYSASKAALLAMAKANALHLGPGGITVNCIAPGPFATEMPMSILSPEQQRALGSRTAMDRWGLPHELAPAALLLASDAGSYITGTVLVVDGGATARMF